MIEPKEMTTVLRYNPDREDYVLSLEELNSFEAVSQSNARDFFLICVSLWLSCGLNSIAEYSSQTQTHFTLPLFFNSCICLASFCLAIYFFINWRRDKQKVKDLMGKIKNKPKTYVTISTQTSSPDQRDEKNVDVDTQVST